MTQLLREHIVLARETENGEAWPGVNPFAQWQLIAHIKPQTLANLGTMKFLALTQPFPTRSFETGLVPLVDEEQRLGLALLCHFGYARLYRVVGSSNTDKRPPCQPVDILSLRQKKDYGMGDLSLLPLKPLQLLTDRQKLDFVR